MLRCPTLGRQVSVGAVALLALVACGSDTVTSSTGTPSGAGSGGTGGIGGASSVLCPTQPPCSYREQNCLSFAPEDDCLDYDCGLAEPCAAVAFDAVDSAGSAYTLATPDALICLFEALRDGESGAYRWSRQPVAGGPGFPSDRHTIRAIPGRQALLTNYSYGSLGGTQFAYGPVELAAPTFWEQCLLETEPAAQLVCLEAIAAACP
jgi:hypothetical protein